MKNNTLIIILLLVIVILQFVIMFELKDLREYTFHVDEATVDRLDALTSQLFKIQDALN